MREYKKRPKRVCSPRRAVWKAAHGIQLNRWELEDLAQDAECALEYARMKGRFLEAEECIAGSRWALAYVRDVVRGRWDREDVFLKNPDLIPDYCVFRGRWREAEERILGYGVDTCLEYHKDVLKRARWREFEERLLGRKFDFFRGWSFWSAVLAYVNQLGGRWEEVEGLMLEKASAKTIFEYSKGLGCRLPGPLHQKMMLLSFEGKVSAKRYLRHLSRLEARCRRYLSGLEVDEVREFLCVGTNSGAA
jgi:hypothetical protein